MYRDIAKFPNGSFKSFIYKFPIMGSRDDYYTILNILKFDKKYCDWTRYHESEFILQEINSAFSNRFLDEWEMIQKNSNCVKSTHRQANNYRQNLTFIQAIET
jgi:hypothetical protein